MQSFAGAVRPDEVEDAVGDDRRVRPGVDQDANRFRRGGDERNALAGTGVGEVGEVGPPVGVETEDVGEGVDDRR